MAPSSNLSVPAAALAVVAHPDDVEFNCGATLARWAAEGCVVSYVICTDGSKGTWDPRADTDALRVIRQQEQREAAEILGVTGEVRFLDVADGELENIESLRRSIALAIRQLTPQVVLAHDPWKRYRIHPDHRAAGFLATDSVVAARDPHFFRDQAEAFGVDAHRPECLLLFEADEVNHVEAASEEGLAKRIGALDAHKSQFETTHHSGFVGEADPQAAFREGERQKLVDQGSPFGVAMAEAFHLIADL